MAYTKSAPLERWLGPRTEVVKVLSDGHAQIGNISGRGRPLDVSKPLAHGYILTMMSEFQGFTRDLHDLAVQRLIQSSGAQPGFVPILTEGMTSGRGIDRGNATLRTLKSDFARIGLTPFRLAAYTIRNGDQDEYEHLVTMRNALAHGNEVNLRTLRARGDQDTVSWARKRLPVLNRMARSIDHLVWDHLQAVTGSANPWR